MTRNSIRIRDRVRVEQATEGKAEHGSSGSMGLFQEQLTGSTNILQLLSE